ncbi:MAG: hypothetical protein Q8J84_07585 [Flavobacteriaceae bacterium]|nr:hypothetical protein [Flavobacteriaceae bacterium]
MLSFDEKISCLVNSLNKTEENYADSFRTELLFFFDEFNAENPLLSFLKDFDSNSEIENWINKLTSRIVMKEDDLEVNEIINDYLELG